MDSGVYSLIGVVIGLAASPLTAFMLEKVRYQRARTDAGQRFQRATLLELQECLAEIARSAAMLHHHDTMSLRETGLWRKSLLPGELNESYRSQQMRASLLMERVLDSELRLHVQNVLQEAGQLIVARSEGDSLDHMMLLEMSWKAANERTGMLLREPYLVDPT